MPLFPRYAKGEKQTASRLNITDDEIRRNRPLGRFIATDNGSLHNPPPPERDELNMFQAQAIGGQTTSGTDKQLKWGSPYLNDLAPVSGTDYRTFKHTINTATIYIQQPGKYIATLRGMIHMPPTDLVNIVAVSFWPSGGLGPLSATTYVEWYLPANHGGPLVHSVTPYGSSYPRVPCFIHHIFDQSELGTGGFEVNYIRQTGTGGEWSDSTTTLSIVGPFTFPQNII